MLGVKFTFELADTEVKSARATTELRMLQQRLAPIRHRRNDLHLRVHILPRLRRQQASWALPQLRRQPGIASHSSPLKASRQSPLNRPRVQAPRLRAARKLNLAQRPPRSTPLPVCRTPRRPAQVICKPAGIKLTKEEASPIVRQLSCHRNPMAKFVATQFN